MGVTRARVLIQKSLDVHFSNQSAVLACQAGGFYIFLREELLHKIESAREVADNNDLVVMSWGRTIDNVSKELEFCIEFYNVGIS